MQNTLRTNQNISPNTSANRRIFVYWPEYDGGEFHDLLVFGPNYMAKAAGFWQQEKKEALRHVLRNSRCSNEELKNAIASIEREARAAYGDDVLNNMTGNFQDMMAEDGCFFLLVAFSLLGAGTELKFPEKHLVFGVGRAAEHTIRWLRSIFLVGNQVPFVALEKVMELGFFQELKAAKQWKQPSEELAKRALYKFLMAGQEPYPVDIIHCLQSIMLGTESGSIGAIPEMLQEIQVIPSALQLSEKGVQFEKLDGELGIRSIHYNHSNFNSVLYLPVLSVDEHTELMVECLRKYEIVQVWRGIKPEASSYFKLLKELILTAKDLEILSSCGVIQGQPESLGRLLSKFHFSETSAHLCKIRQQIKEDRPLPWRKSKKLTFKVIGTLSTCLILLFTYLQAHYTILSYYQNFH